MIEDILFEVLFAAEVGLFGICGFLLYACIESLLEVRRNQRDLAIRETYRPTVEVAARASNLFRQITGMDSNCLLQLSADRTRIFTYQMRKGGRTGVIDPKTGAFLGYVCAHVGCLPDADRMIAEYLMLVNDEHEYWRRVNFGRPGSNPTRSAAYQLFNDYNVNTRSNPS